MQSGLCPYKKRRLGHTETGGRGGVLRTEERPCEEVARGRLPAGQGESPQKKANLPTPDLGHIFQNRENKFLLLMPPSLRYFVMAAPAN